MNLRIALTGYARTGKDEVGKILLGMLPEMKRVAFGDIIKQQLDPVIQQYFGFSAFTEDYEQKELIRPVLVAWGYANYDKIEAEFFAQLPEYAVNTRLFRLREAKRWVASGGIIWEVSRLGKSAAEPKEKEELAACYAAGLIHGRICNDGTVDELKSSVVQLLATLA